MFKSKDQKKAFEPSAAANDNEAEAITVEGKVISVFDNKLMMRNKEGNEHSHILPKDVLLTCDGAVCTSASLRTGNRIRVTTKKNDRNIAIAIEVLDKDPEFATPNS